MRNTRILTLTKALLCWLGLSLELVLADDDSEELIAGSPFEKVVEILKLRGIDIYDPLEDCDMSDMLGFSVPGPVVGEDPSLLDAPTGKDCSDNETIAFGDSLDSFETCAGTDLQKWMVENSKTFFDLGEACMDKLGDMDPSDIDESVIVNECVSGYLGEDSLGRSIRSFFSYSEVTCSCLEPFQESLPGCKYYNSNTSAVLDGSNLGQASCILDSLCGMINSVCRKEMKILNDCLDFEYDDVPLLTQDGSRPFCERVTKDCKRQKSLFFLFEDEVLFASGIPLACRHESDSVDLFRRYDGFQGHCKALSSHVDSLLIDPKDLEGIKEEPTPKDDEEKEEKEANSGNKKRSVRSMVELTATTVACVIFVTVLCYRHFRSSSLPKRSVYNAVAFMQEEDFHSNPLDEMEGDSFPSDQPPFGTDDTDDDELYFDEPPPAAE